VALTEVTNLGFGLVVTHQASGRKIPRGERGPASVAVVATLQARSGSCPSGVGTLACEAGDIERDRNAVGEIHIERLT